MTIPITTFVSNCFLLSATLMALLVPVQKPVTAKDSSAAQQPEAKSIPNVTSPLFISQNLQSYMPDYATSITQATDVSPTDWSFQSLQSAIERTRIIRLYSDGTFKGRQAATRFEMVDWFGAMLDRIFTLGETACNLRRPSRSFSPDSNISSNAFYYQSYLTMGRATGAKLIYQPGSSNPELDGNSALRRVDAAVILNRYFFRPIELFTQRVGSLNAPTIATKSLVPSQLAQMTSAQQIEDISPSNIYYKDIENMVVRWGTLGTYPDRTFRPNQSITRYELVSMLTAAADRANELIAATCENQNNTPSNDNQVTIVNDSDRTISYTLNGSQYSLDPGEKRVHAGSSSFKVDFDSSFLDGYQGTTYQLKLGTVNRFKRVGNLIDLLFD